MPGTVPARVLLYRITHYQNLPDIVQRGMFCANHPQASKGVGIGNDQSPAERFIVPERTSNTAAKWKLKMHLGDNLLAT